MTKIFANRSDFFDREDKTENGVNAEFAEAYPNWEAMNETNKGCWNCSDCSRCSRCSDCSGCSGCSRCSGCSDCSDCSDCSRCSDCSGCSRCSGCSDCSDCSRCSYKRNLEGQKSMAIDEAPWTGFPDVPVIENIHQKVYDAASRPKGLNMSNWHTCDTTHCRAGWAVFLAGPEGKALEEKTTTLFAAMQIYKASSPHIRVSPPRFFESNAEAMQDMKACAEKESALTVK